MVNTFKIDIQGQVQGVGFRPFIFSLAYIHCLFGEVFNDENGVVIYINTTDELAKKFLSELIANAPKVSIIQSYRIQEVEKKDFSEFKIIFSSNGQKLNLPLTPDFAICEDCKSEITDPDNRRFQYAFTTCVKCGPRYSITEKFSFERENTSLTNFEMCSECKAEYKNPKNRRFHSQTNSCPNCGITMKLAFSEGLKFNDKQIELLDEAAKLISNGKIIAIKNTNGYLLCCDARNLKAISRLREKKQRPSKPFALLYPSLEMVKNHCHISNTEENALNSAEAPILILQTKPAFKNIAQNEIAPNLDQLGVMLPSSALLHLLLLRLGFPIVATSGNLHGSPIISNEKDAEKKLKNVADAFLHHNLDIQFAQDDSVIKFVGAQKIVLRRARGLSPNNLYVDNSNSTSTSISFLLAMGAHLKSTFTYVPNTQTYISQYFGNLDNYEVLQRFEQTIQKFIQVFKTEPKTVLVDTHPHYQSTILGRELASNWRANVVEIQHHKAHFTSVLAENNLLSSKEKILGIIWDGTGYGDDGNIWGGEFFMCEKNKIKRLTHFEYFDWIAADKFSKEPRLCLLSILSEEDREIIKPKFSEIEFNIYKKLLKNNTLKTSSVGRLFDAVASALSITDYNSFEGEAAMRLENLALKYSGNENLDFLEDEIFDQIPTKKLVFKILNCISKGNSKEKIASDFIFTLANSVITIAKKENISTIACSGGVFQNSVLIRMLLSLTSENGIKLNLNRNLSCNDENISFGQLQYFNTIIN